MQLLVNEILVKTFSILIEFSQEHLLCAINRHDLKGRRKVKWEFAKRIASSAISLYRSVEDNLKDFKC